MTVGLVKMICERGYGEDAERSGLKPDVRVFHVKPQHSEVIKAGMQLRGYTVTLEKI